MQNLLQAVEWSYQKFVGPGLQVYGLATPPPPGKANQLFKNQKFNPSQVCP